MMCLEEEFENHPFILLISNKEFMKSMRELFWEIRAEEIETGQPFRSIKERRIKELGYQPGSHEYQAAEEGIHDTENDVAIGYAEAQSNFEEDKWAQWEQEQIDAGFVRMFFRKLEQG